NIRIPSKSCSKDNFPFGGDRLARASVKASNDVFLLRRTDDVWSQRIEFLLNYSPREHGHRRTYHISLLGRMLCEIPCYRSVGYCCERRLFSVDERFKASLSCPPVHVNPKLLWTDLMNVDSDFSLADRSDSGMHSP